MIYVVCCNDSLQYASIDLSKATEKCNEEILKCKNLDLYYWHIHEVKEIQ